MPPTQTTSILALDVGEKRIGVSIASHAARLPRPLTTLAYDDTIWDRLQNLVAEEAVDVIVVGLPRNLNGQETAQSTFARNFAKDLSTRIALPIRFQDETLSSRRAEAELASRGKPFAKGEIDALAAVLILEDYLNSSESTAS